MNLEGMSGQHRKLSSYLQPFEQRLVRQWAPRVPKWLETYHLTSMTLLFSGLAIGVGYLSKDQKFFLMFNSLLVFLQYITDVLDGAVGRYRDTGLVRWGFYMDHLFDYVFSTSMLISYSIAYQFQLEVVFVLLLVAAGYFIHELLMASAVGRLNTSGYYGFGPTEIRAFAVLIGFILPFASFNIVLNSAKALGLFFGLFFIQLIYRSQKKLWKIDMENKKKSK